MCSVVTNSPARRHAIKCSATGMGCSIKQREVPLSLTAGACWFPPAFNKKRKIGMEVTRERLEHAVNYVAGVMVRLDLPQLAPILDRLQTELAKFEAGED